MAYIERRVSRRRDASGRMRENIRYKVRYRDSAGSEHSETLAATHRRRTTEGRDRGRPRARDLAGPQAGEILLRQWVSEWLPTRHDLRATTKARLELTMAKQVLPRFGAAPARQDHQR